MMRIILDLSEDEIEEFQDLLGYGESIQPVRQIMYEKLRRAMRKVGLRVQTHSERIRRLDAQIRGSHRTKPGAIILKPGKYVPNVSWKEFLLNEMRQKKRKRD